MLRCPCAVVLTLVAVAALAPAGVESQQQPNIVLVFMDNFGWGEPGFNGGQNVA